MGKFKRMIDTRCQRDSGFGYCINPTKIEVCGILQNEQFMCKWYRTNVQVNGKGIINDRTAGQITGIKKEKQAREYNRGRR